MSRKRRSHRGGAAVLAPSAQAAAAPAKDRPGKDRDEEVIPPLPTWHWRTFPVYFALTLGGFIGVYAGYLTGYVAGQPDGSTVPSLLAFGVAAVLLGIGVARIAVRGLMGWGIIKPIPKKAPKK